jgi:hypothetical protein
VIDTTGRAIDGEENSADSYREFARTTGLALKRSNISCIRTDHAGKDGGKKQGQRGSSAKNDDVDIVYRLDKSDDGLTMKRTHTRISWVPETVNLVVEDLDDIITIRLRTKEQRGWTPAEIALAKRLDELGIPKDAGVNETQRIAKKMGVTLARKSILGRAILCRQLPSPDPLNSGTTSGNHFVEPNVDKGTTPRTVRYGGVPSLPQTIQNIPNQNIDNQDNIESELW